MEEKSKYQLHMVRETLEELITNGMILKLKGENSKTVYRINKEKSESVKEFLGHKSE